MKSRVDHYTSIDVDLDNGALLLEESHALVETVVHATQSDKVLATFNELRFEGFGFAVVL